MERIILPLYYNELSDPNRIVNAYFWNKGNTKIYVDDLTVYFY